ncbi:unnamed protein product [Blepharisma stoltei]|uniref:Uncharacterized protein n=1 Tax=Blepharisma stoltei TaxID=1481888 RepID=A0AAU9JP34_9CILI|nr:unnamed protein product [Blepharisma stoltei]
MSLLDPNEAAKIFFLENHEIISSWHKNTNKNSLAYLKIPKFKLGKYSEENIRLMIENNDATSISEYFRVINCLAYNRDDKIKFVHLEELLGSKYELPILSLLIKSPIDNLEERFANQVFRLLESNDIYDWMRRSDSFVSESLKVKEKIVSFATYFSFVLKYSEDKLKFIRELGEWNLIKTSEFLMRFAFDRNECVDEFFSFNCEALKFFKIEFNFLREQILNNLIDNICSWQAFSNALSLANHIKFEQSTIEKLCKITHDFFYWNWDTVLDFFTSGEEVLKISYNYLKSNYISLKSKRSIDMMTKILEVLFIYTSNIAKKSASALFEDIKLDEFIKTEEVLDHFILPIENIINAQLTSPDRWYNLLDAFFETLPNVKNKSLERAKSHVPMQALNLYLDRNRIQEWKIKKIQQYLQSFISQFEEINNWTKIEISDFFIATFSYLPTIQSDFNTYLNTELLPSWNKMIAPMEERIESEDIDANLRNQWWLLYNAIGVAKSIKNLQINTKDQFNYLAVNEFEDFIGTYISIIRKKKVKKLFLFYRDISAYLEDFNFNKISYEDSKNRVTIAKYFICLIKNSLAEVFKEYANKLKKKLQESEDKVINTIEPETIEQTKDSSIMKNTSLESEEENLPSLIERALTGDQQIVCNSCWNIFFTSKVDQANKLEEFLISFLHKMVFSDDAEHFILRQYLASHLTRLFNGTLNKENADFFTEGKQRAIKLHFKSPERLNKTQKEELTTILFSTPIKGAFSNENIWNKNIRNLVETTYFANIPDNLSGMTVFGGTILLHPSLSQSDDLKSCARKITFIHEAAHAMRKYNEGSYNPEKKTPKSTKTLLLSGMPGNSEFSSFLKDHDINEGGKLIENAIFGAFFTKINKSQIDYINNLSNWSQSTESFKRHIEEKGQEVSKAYELARGSHYISGMRNDGCEYY